MTGHRIFLTSAEAKARAHRWIDAAPHGMRVEFREPKRSDEQNRKLWASLADVSRQVVWYGVKLSSEDWKDLFTASLRKTRVVPGIDSGSFVPLGMRTSDMGKAEFGDLLELIAAFGAEHGVVFSDPADVSSGRRDAA